MRTGLLPVALLLCACKRAPSGPTVLVPRPGAMACQVLGCSGAPCAELAETSTDLADGVRLTCGPRGLILGAWPGAAPGAYTGACGPLTLTVSVAAPE